MKIHVYIEKLVIQATYRTYLKECQVVDTGHKGQPNGHLLSDMMYSNGQHMERNESIFNIIYILYSILTALNSTTITKFYLQGHMTRPPVLLIQTKCILTRVNPLQFVTSRRTLTCFKMTECRKQNKRQKR